ncbi:MAG: SDR family oxidoreductase [Gammaproteobacteria bacterium]|nr:SDR family oxidoreductase [Gammaproteobacteria bacterium]
MEIRMDGRVALITGGSKGLGYAMGLKFAKSGAQVALAARTEAEVRQAALSITQTTGQKAVGYAYDVANADDIKQLHQAVTTDFERIDILVNNAGFAKAGAFESVTDDEWQYDLDLKLMAAVRLSRLVLPSMKANRWGRIINMLNTLAKTPAKGSAPTSVTRAAGMALTKVLAGEGAAHNVLVNALNIGRIESDQMVRAHKASGSNDSLETFIKAAGKSLPMGRLGYADECASLACLLCSDAGGYISGTAINVDGNLSPAL